jgi:hypothetical protein
MATPLPPVPPLTERQALIYLSALFGSLVQQGESSGSVGAAGDALVELTGALAVIAGALVQSGPSSYRAGTYAPLSVSTTGALRVQPEDQSVAWFGPNLWAGRVPGRR